MRGYSQCNVNWLNGFVGNLDLSEAITGGVVSAGDFIKEETLVQVFSCEFCKNFLEYCFWTFKGYCYSKFGKVWQGIVKLQNF